MASRQRFALYLCVLPSIALAAQLPTDIELRASYCVGIVQAKISRSKTLREKELADPPSGEERKVYDETIRTLRQHELEDGERLKRLQAYVLPKMDALDAISMMTAHARAQVDVEAAGKERAACAESCWAGRAKVEYMQCVTPCLSNTELQRRVSACDSLDWLPF